MASYKFALAKSLMDLADRDSDIITLEELARPFSHHISSHLLHAKKQGISPTSRFLDACRDFNDNKINEAELIDKTASLGFVNVIDAFHVVNQEEIPVRFYIDERKGQERIRLTDNFYLLNESVQLPNLLGEVEARWRLVETAWELNIDRNLIDVHYSPTDSELVTYRSNRRRNVTSAREALSGYQKGRCFYCFDVISILPNSANLADVDHFFPHILKALGLGGIVDEVWNLVLSCIACNRGSEGKAARVPAIHHLERLFKRNEYFISSHHPLRETIIRQTGNTSQARAQYHQHMHDEALTRLIHTWVPEVRGPVAF
ncbi:HNH endonuclease [Gemmatimonadota bacterium]